MEATYLTSRIWCKGCGEYREGNNCANPEAVKYGHRLGNSKPIIPCWLVRGTCYCLKEEK